MYVSQAFEAIGVIDPILRACRNISATVVRTRYHTVETGTFALLAKYTKYPYMIAIPQHVTEKILHDAVHECGIPVHRPHRVVDLKPNAATRDHLNIVVNYPPTQTLSANEQDLVWTYRYYLSSNKKVSELTS